MALPHTFSSQTSPTMSELDDNFAALGAIDTIPCSVTGTNSMTLTPAANTPTVSAYTQLQRYSGITVAANTAATTARVDSLASLPVYKDTPAGVVALSGGEYGSGCFIILTYDSALNSGAGGFHLSTAPDAPTYASGAESTITSAVGVSLNAAQVTGSSTGQGVILRQGAPGAGYNDQVPIAANIISALPGAVVGSIFRFRVINTSGQTQTITTNTGITLTGGMTTADGATHDFIGRITSASAVTIYG